MEKSRDLPIAAGASLDKGPDEPMSDAHLCSRKMMMDDVDEDAWMKDENDSWLDDNERSEEVLPFGLNHSWPRVSSASRSTSGLGDRPRKFLRQISQESLDESTSLLLGHVVILPDLPRDHVVEPSRQLDGLLETDENMPGTEDKIFKPCRSDAGRDFEEMEHNPEENVRGMKIMREDVEKVPGMKDRGPVCLHNAWVSDEIHLQEESNEDCAKNILHLHKGQNQSGLSSENICSAPEFHSDNVVSDTVADMMIHDKTLSENMIPSIDSQVDDTVDEIVSDPQASAEDIHPTADLQSADQNLVSEMIANMMVKDEVHVLSTESQDGGENVVSKMIANEMIRDQDFDIGRAEGEKVHVVRETIVNKMIQDKNLKDGGENVVSGMIANEMIKDQSSNIGQADSQNLVSEMIASDMIEDRNLDFQEENVVSKMIAMEMTKGQNLNEAGGNVVSEMIVNEMIQEQRLKGGKDGDEKVVGEVTANEMIQDQNLNVVKTEEGNVVSAMIGQQTVQDQSCNLMREGRKSEDKSKVFPKNYSPSNKVPRLHRRISRESFEESTSLLLDHVVVIDPHGQMGGMGTTDKTGRCPFLVDITENPLIHEASGAIGEEEEQFVYKGEVNSSDSEEDVTEDCKANSTTASSLLDASTSTRSIISEEAASTLKEIELIRVDLDDAILTLQSLKDEFPTRTVDLPQEDLANCFKVEDSCGSVEERFEITENNHGIPDEIHGHTSNSSVSVDESDRPTCTASCRTPDESVGATGGSSCETAEDGSLFNQLPDEVILHVFRYLSHGELCRSVVTVCKKWHHLALDPTLWQHLDLSFNSPFCPPVNREALLQRCSLLQSLTLRGLEEVYSTEMEVVVRHCPRIQELDLGFVSNFDDALFDVLVCGCQTLTCLNVEGCDQITDSLVSKLIFLPRLKTLRLSHCTKLTDEAVCEIARFCQYLEELDIDGIPWITDSAIVTLVMERRSTLQCLKLDGAELTDIAIRHILRCPDLEELNVSFCEQFTDQTLERIQEWKKPLRLRLQKGKEFSEAGLINIFNTPTLSQLTLLNLSECSELRDQAVINIAQRCPLLTHLAMEWCWFVTDVGLVQIVDNCRHLRHLDLIGLHAILGHCLADVPAKLPRLQFLDLRQCNSISDGMLVQLVFKKHDLTIMNYYGEEVRHDDIPTTLAF